MTCVANDRSTKLPRTSSDYSSNATHCEKNFLVNSRHNFDRTRNVGITTIDNSRSVLLWYRECSINFGGTDSVDCILDLNENKKCRLETFSDGKRRLYEPERAENRFKPKIRSQVRRPINCEIFSIVESIILYVKNSNARQSVE